MPRQIRASQRADAESSMYEGKTLSAYEEHKIADRARKKQGGVCMYHPGHRYIFLETAFIREKRKGRCTVVLGCKCFEVGIIGG